jgi:hypothetical protein
MPKFLAGCHYNDEEISQALYKKKKKRRRYWPVQMNGKKFATGQNLKKTGRSCEGADFSWLSSNVSQTLVLATPPMSRSRAHFCTLSLSSQPT